MSAHWNVLLVDDEQDVHTISNVALRRKQWRGKSIKLHSAFSGEEARTLLGSPSCPAFEVAIVDVVMETPNAGLDLIRHMRRTCPSSLRIVLRTGQPGSAPEEVVLNEYDIDYYLSKPEVTADKLFSVVRACVRSSQDISTLLAFSRQLRGFTQALQNVTTLHDLLVFMNEGLKFLELKFSGKVSFVHDVYDDGRGENGTSMRAPAAEALGALQSMHARGFDPMTLVYGAEFGLGDRSFLMPFVVVSTGEDGHPERTPGGLHIEFEPGFTTEKNLADFTTDCSLFLENWVTAYSALKLQERVARDRMLRERMYLERVESIANMVTGIAHEINTPLGVANTANSLVSAAVDELKAKLPASDETVSDLGEASRLLTKNIQRAHDLIRSFKQLSAGQLSDQRQLVPLHLVVQDCVETLAPELRKHQVTVDVRPPDAASDMEWDGYPGHLSQVVINLVQNAMKYAYPGTATGRVEIRFDSFEVEDVPWLRIEVQDFGKGMPPEIRRRIFDAFFTTGSGTGGTGLGLAIVQNIVTNLLFGQIRVTSEVGVGSTFVVEFPKQIPEPKQNRSPA